MNRPSNIFAEIPAHLPNELVQKLLTTKSNLRIERIVSKGHSSPEGFWYDQDEHEWVVVLQGAARLRFEDEILEMNAGSFVLIDPHRRHRVEWTAPDEPTIWLAIYFGD